MEITRLTPKGKISIPEELRHGFQSGAAFAVERRDDTIILTKVGDNRSDGELTDWAKKELSEARNTPEEGYVTLEKLEAELLSK